MGIQLQFNVLLIRKAEIDQRYPGGLKQFRVERTNFDTEPYCEDEHLVACSSMGGYYWKLAKHVMTFGISVCEASEHSGPCGNCDWLETEGPPGWKVSWLKGMPQGEVVSFNREWKKGN